MSDYFANMVNFAQYCIFCANHRPTSTVLPGNSLFLFANFCKHACTHVHTHTPTHEGSHLDVKANRLTFKVGPLISRISERSKRPI